MPSRLNHTASTGTEAVVALEPRASKGVAFSNVSLVRIGRDELPYKHLITAAISSLYLQLDELSLAVDFVKGVSGHVLISRAGDAAVGSKDCSVVELKDIPIARELLFECPRGSNELAIWLQSSSKGIICVTFVWERASSWMI